MANNTYNKTYKNIAQKIQFDLFSIYLLPDMIIF